MFPSVMLVHHVMLVHAYHVFEKLMWVHVMLFEVMYVQIMFVHDMLVHGHARFFSRVSALPWVRLVSSYVDLVRLPPVLDDRLRSSGSQECEEDSAAGGTPVNAWQEEPEEEEPALPGAPPEPSPEEETPAAADLAAPPVVPSQVATPVAPVEAPVPEAAMATVPGMKAEATEAIQVTSTTHKKQWNLLTRVAAGPRATEFPEVSRLFSGNKQEKLQALRLLVKNGDNLQGGEASVKIQKQHLAKTTSCRRLMTIAQMQQEGCSERLVCKYFQHSRIFFNSGFVLAFLFLPRMKIAACVARGGMDDPDCPHDQASRRYWCYLGGDETQEDSTSTTLQANITASSAATGLAVQAPQPVLQLPASDPLAMVRQQLQQAQPAASPTEAPATPAPKRTFVATYFFLLFQVFLFAVLSIALQSGGQPKKKASAKPKALPLSDPNLAGKSLAEKVDLARLTLGFSWLCQCFQQFFCIFFCIECFLH